MQQVPRATIAVLLLLTALATKTPGARAADAPQSDKATEEFRDRVWSFGLVGKRHAWKSNDRVNELLGNVAEIQIATGVVKRKWLALGSVDIILGPYEAARKRQVNVDYYGTGFTAWWGFSAQLGDLRSVSDGYGFALGLSYADIVGRRSNAIAKTAARSAEITAYQMRVASISLVPALFFCWLEPGRAKGNKPELLTTRVEGYVLTAGLQIPVHAPFQVRYEVTDTSASKVSLREKGQLHGYSVLVALHTLLGI